MRVALFGEYSGFHLELARGLEKLGHIAHVFSTGDGFKKIQSTHELPSPGRSYYSLGQFLLSTQPKLLRNILDAYDVVQIINPDFIVAPNHFSTEYLSFLGRLIKKSKAIKLLAVVGCDARVLPALAELPSSPCPGCLNDSRRSRCHYAEKRPVAASQMLESSVDVIIPFGSAAYAKSYGASTKNAAPLMFPIDVSKIDNTSNVYDGDKIIVLHGLNRPGFKGTRTIANVFAQLETEFPGRFDFLLPDRLPFDEYMRLLNRANIIVDQLHGDALAMNSLYSMARGRVVMTCHDKRVSVGGVRLSESPAIEIHDQSSLKAALERVLQWSPADFRRLGALGREFVQANCAAEKVARDFVAVVHSVRRVEDGGGCGHPERT